LNKCTKINLMFEDESELCDLELSRTYISYIGTIAKDHAFLEFINSAIYIIDNNIFPAYQILIATKSDLPKHVVSRIAPYILNNRMVVKSGRPFTNKEINHFFQSSIVVWNAYKRSMQSGVLAKSYMFGSPVIISENNESEFFIDGKTGVKVSSSYDAVEIAESIRVVSKNFTKMSANVRSMFLDKFHYKSMEFIFLNILKRRQND